MPQNFLHSQDKAVIAKSGINRQGKQKYAVNYNGKTVKTSIHREKLEKVCDEINIYGIDAFLDKKHQKKSKARVTKYNLRDGKEVMQFFIMVNLLKLVLIRESLKKYVMR